MKTDGLFHENTLSGNLSVIPSFLFGQGIKKLYSFIFMDVIHYKMKENSKYVTKVAYSVLGIIMKGRKDIPGIWIGGG